MKIWYCFFTSEIMNGHIHVFRLLKAHLTTFEEISSGLFEKERCELAYVYGSLFRIEFFAVNEPLEFLKGGEYV